MSCPGTKTEHACSRYAVVLSSERKRITYASARQVRHLKPRGIGLSAGLDNTDHPSRPKPAMVELGHCPATDSGLLMERTRSPAP